MSWQNRELHGLGPNWGFGIGVGKRGKRETPTWKREFPKFPKKRWEKKGAGRTFENDKKRGVSLNDLYKFCFSFVQGMR